MDIKQVYEEINGDYEGVLSRLPKPELVQNFAIKFLDDTSVDSLSKALEEDNMEEAFRAAHTLKGICLNLGFTGLFESAEVMTEALRPGNEHPSKEEVIVLFKRVEKDYLKVISSINKLL